MPNRTPKPPTPLKAIRAKCLDCCYDQAQEVKLCPCVDCPLYPYRFGKSMKSRSLSLEQRQAAAERMKVNRQRLPKQAVSGRFLK